MIEKGEISKCDLEIIVFIMLCLYVLFIFDWEKNYELLEKEKIVELFEFYLLKGLLN